MLDIKKLRALYQQVRATSEKICAPLTTEDHQIQAIVETSPPKWHLAHVSWFFETFVLKPHQPGYQPAHPQYEMLFNSYYNGIGEQYPRPDRGLLARPTVAEIYAYRQQVDDAMLAFFAALATTPQPDVLAIIELGLHHEQQHQELMLMDIKYNFSINPLRPAYRDDLATSPQNHTLPVQWHTQAAGLYEVGHRGDSFAYDNESPRHQQYLIGYQLANRLVTNGEFRAFIDDGGYQRPDLWLADGWNHIRQHHWQQPLYWAKIGDDWEEMTLRGWHPLNPHAPVCHVSYYEADAYARWAGKRLPTEAELEVVLAQQPLSGNFFDQDYLHPQPAGEQGQWFGDVWAWTASAYHPYPGFQPLAGAAGEYNGKFMCNQMVLRGGACVTSQDHLRASYRNFFYPHDRWQFSGIRLAA